MQSMLAGSEPIWVLGSVILLLALLATGRFQPFKLFGGLVFIYYLSGLISLGDMLANFVNPALVTLVSLLLVSLVFEKTNWVSSLSKKLFAKNLTLSYLRMGLFIGSSSAFLNNTAVVATMLSAVRKNGFHLPSKLLIPLSYFAILGGTLTLIGTSTNLIVNGFVVQAGLPGLGLFDFLYVGLPLLLVGILGVVFISSRMLPSNKDDDENTTDYLIETKIRPSSPVIGKTVQEAGLRQLEGLFLVQIYRKDRLISPVSPYEVIQKNDHLLFSGDVQQAKKLSTIAGIEIAGHKGSFKQSFVEVVLAHTSSLIGQTIKEAGFRNKFDAAVVAIHRGEHVLQTRLAETELQAGDSLVLAAGPDFDKRENLKQNFYFYTPVNEVNFLSPLQNYLVAGSFVTVLAGAALEFFPLVKGLLVMLAGLLAFKLLTFGEIKRRFPYELVIIIGSALGIASVLMASGTAQMIAHFVMGIFSIWGVWGSLVGVFLFTLLLTELITNNAAAAIAFPVALATSEIMGASPWPFIMVVAYGASASFLTPYGYQTNLMIYAPGNYRFVDFIRAGLPITVLYSMVVLLMVPLVFPFQVS
ncbi:SLC13 family permease [Thiomicrorhabdus heinhorstiae]|uniref:SLC13 family permease n=1 Tax=Thiomicrorhabdus heinhorstiae TaxID=2748010 RepID=UPI00163D747E|nr:SLC13 family permease [Thiomicrorhabdus heinhorstiae]